MRIMNTISLAIYQQSTCFLFYLGSHMVNSERACFSSHMINNEQ